MAWQQLRGRCADASGSYDQTGKIIWSINSAGDVVENEMAVQQEMIDALEIMADDKKKGGVEKSAIAGMINRQLGLHAQQKK